MVTKTRKRPHRRYGWHLLKQDKTLNYRDGRAVVVGKTLSITGRPVLCQRGMHASPDIKHCMFGLVVAPKQEEPWLCRVSVGHATKNGGDKFVGKSRRVLWMRQLTKEVLRRAAKELRVFGSDDVQPVELWTQIWYQRGNKAEAWFLRYARRHGCPKTGLT